MIRILICGLPGSGKTTLARKLKNYLDAEWYNADKVRETYQDWDFSPEGRLRQAKRLKKLSQLSSKEYVIVDFICPTKDLRKFFDANIVIWMDTIKAGRFDDTNKMFEPLKEEEYTYKIEVFNSDYWANYISKELLNGKI